MKILVTLFVLSLIGCGGAATPYPQIGSPTSSAASVGSTNLTATMTSSGSGTPGTWVVTKAGKLLIPALSNFAVLEDTFESWQVNILVNNGVQSCNFSHVGGQSGMSQGTGCSVSTGYISVNVGDTVSVSIATGVTQTASVSVTLTETN